MRILGSPKKELIIVEIKCGLFVKINKNNYLYKDNINFLTIYNPWLRCYNLSDCKIWVILKGRVISNV